MWAGASARATHDTGCWTEVWGVKSRTVLNDVTRKFWILHATSGGAVRAFSVRKLCRYSAIHRYRQCAQICRKYYSRVSGTYSSSYSTRELQLLDPGVKDCGSRTAQSPRTCSVLPGSPRLVDSVRALTSLFAVDDGIGWKLRTAACARACCVEATLKRYIAKGRG